MQHGPVLISGSVECRQGGRFASHGGGTDAHPDRDIRLTLPANARNVVLVRHVVSAMADELALPSRLTEDIRLAVTEACTNVVRHAYAGVEGPLAVAIEPRDDAVTITVADEGDGLRPNPQGDGAGLGLPLMASLSHAMEIERNGERGSCVRMWFRRER